MKKSGVFFLLLLLPNDCINNATLTDLDFQHEAKRDLLLLHCTQQKLSKIVLPVKPNNALWNRGCIFCVCVCASISFHGDDGAFYFLPGPSSMF